MSLHFSALFPPHFSLSSRSCAVAIGYIISTTDIDMSAALALVREKRPQARPNSGFCAQLLAMQRRRKVR